MIDRPDYEKIEDLDEKDKRTPKEKLELIREITVFYKSLYGDASYNDLQGLMDKIIKICSNA